MKINEITKQIKNYIKSYTDSLPDEQRKKIISYVYITLTLLTVSFFGLFAITPTLTTIVNLNKQYEDNQLVYEALNRKLSNLQLLDFQYQEIQPDLESIYNAIPRSTNIPQLTRQVENLAAQDNVIISRLNFGSVEIEPNSKEDSIYSFTFTVIVVGGEDSVNKFIADIISFDRIVGIDRIVTGVNEEGQYTAQITGRVYFSIN